MNIINKLKITYDLYKNKNIKLVLSHVIDFEFNINHYNNMEYYGPVFKNFYQKTVNIKLVIDDRKEATNLYFNQGNILLKANTVYGEIICFVDNPSFQSWEFDNTNNLYIFELYAHEIMVLNKKR